MPIDVTIFTIAYAYSVILFPAVDLYVYEIPIRDNHQKWVPD